MDLKFLILISKYKFIIKKLKHLMTLLSYNQSNMSLDEMVRFLQDTQNTYNQLLSNYIGVFYVIRKCQYKNLCFDCAIVTGQLGKLIMETNYTTNDNRIQISDKKVYYLLKSIDKLNETNFTSFNNKSVHRLDRKHKLSKKDKRYKNDLNYLKSKFTLIQSVNLTNDSTLDPKYNLTELLRINKKLTKRFNRLTKKNDKKEVSKRKFKHTKHVKKKELAKIGPNNL